MSNGAIELPPVTVEATAPPTSTQAPAGSMSLPTSLSALIVLHNTFQILVGASTSSLVDVTAMFPPLQMVAIHFEDPISFQADTLELTFQDIGDKIIKSAQIKKGLWMKIKIFQYNRDYPGSKVLRDLGSFQIDQIKQRWPISQTTLMATSVPIDQQIKLTLKNKVRFTSSLKDLGQRVATENGLGFLWDVPKGDVDIGQVNQWNESDLQMLSKYCKSNALSMKIKDINGKQTLVIFDEQEYEKKAPVFTIDFAQKGAGFGLIHGELTTQSQDIYSTATLSYYDPNTNQVYVAKANAPIGTADGSAEELRKFYSDFLAENGSGEGISVDGEGSTDLFPTPQDAPLDVPPPLYGTNPNTQDNTATEAMQILRAKNLKEFRSILTSAGSLCFPNGIAIESGIVVTFKNKGLFDGNWIIQKVTIHTSDARLNSDIEFRKCLIPVAGTTSTELPN
jgi:hypothetical protein